MILYILIGSEKKPLANYSKYISDEMTNQAESFLNKGSAQKQMDRIKTEYYCIFSQEVNNITYIVLTTNNFPLPAGASCVESLIKDIGPLLQGRNFKKIKKYGLNDELSKIIKTKFDFFNENTDYISEEHYTLKNELTKQRDYIFQAAQNYDERRNYLDEITKKQKDLEADSYNYREKHKKYKEEQCRKKAHLITYIVLGTIILGLIILIIILSTKK